MGRILTPALYAATMDAFRGDFFRQYKAAPEEAVMAIASALPATGGTVKNRGLGATPEMAEWVGPKVRQHLLDHSFDVEIVDYQATIEVHQNDIEDDQLGQYAEKIADLAVRAKGYLAPIVEQLVANNTALGYDGKALFANDTASTRAARRTTCWPARAPPSRWCRPTSRRSTPRWRAGRMTGARSSAATAPTP